MEPIASFSGLASGIQWRDMVDQIMSIEKTRRINPLNTQISQQQKRINAWNGYQSAITKLGDAARKLRDGSAFDAFSVNVPNSAATGRALFSASTSAAASAGTYKVEVLDLARSEKLSGNAVPSSTDALGISGDFWINGRRIEVTAADSLGAVRDKINAGNTGTDPSRVSATILSTAGTANRLVLTSDTSGAAGVELTDGASGTLGKLGFTDGTLAANLTGDGQTQSNRFTSTTAAIATMLGVTMPPPSTVTIGGKAISVDLSVDSLSSIAARIEAAGGSAAVEETSVGGTTGYRLKAGGTASADTADGKRALEALGMLQGGRGAVAQSLSTENTLTGLAGNPATASTSLVELGTNGAAGNVRAGDTFSLRGTRADGTAVNLSYTVSGTDTVQDVLNRLNNTVDGFGAGTRPATASLVNGKIQLVDAQGGDSQLSLSLIANNESGASLTFGKSVTETTGRLREVVNGSDAQFRVDGTLFKRGSNAVTDAVTGVTLNLQQAEAGSVVDLAITRDTGATVDQIKEFATAYNEARAFVKTQLGAGGALASSGALRSSMSAFTGALLTEVGLGGAGAYNRTALIGVALSKTGTLDVDADALTQALATNLDDVRRLFGGAFTASDSAVELLGAPAGATQGSYAVEVSAAATAPSQTGAGFSGVYADDLVADTMTITDGGTGRTGSIQLANGDTTDTILGKLNTLFQSQGMGMTASKNGNDLVLNGARVGSRSSFSVAYTGGGIDATATLGFPAGTRSGTDVQGTIGGNPATGDGDVLTGTSGATAGFSLRYRGAVAGSFGTVDYVDGVAARMLGSSDLVTRAGDGLVATQTGSLQNSIGSLNNRVADAESRLELRRAALIKQFTRMEESISRIQSQGNWLSSQINALQPRAS